MKHDEANHIAAHVRRSLTEAGVDLLRSPKSHIEAIISNATLEAHQKWSQTEAARKRNQ